jgi:6-pyruvoyltetrahydropterin/6-carboxytetrahydropterin synthase
MGITCTRKLSFSAGHRVLGHEGVCAYPHGHNYHVWITAEAEKLDEIGRVIDFFVLKEKVGGWLDSHWDHTFLLFEEDQEMISALKIITGPRKPFLCPFNPTAENMAYYLLKVVCPEVLAATGITVVRVVVEETSNCSAEATMG